MSFVLKSKYIAANEEILQRLLNREWCEWPRFSNIDQVAKVIIYIQWVHFDKRSNFHASNIKILGTYMSYIRLKQQLVIGR